MVNSLVTATLQGLGINVVDLGLSTTPTVEVMVPELKADGGIILTASHNPKQWNALKLLNENKNQVVKRSFILETIWGKDDYFLGRSLDVFISRLRKYLAQDERIKIENIHGVGFKFRVDD